MSKPRIVATVAVAVVAGFAMYQIFFRATPSERKEPADSTTVKPDSIPHEEELDFTGDAESQEAPEYAPSIWTMEPVSSLSEPARVWPDADTPTVNELPDTLTWNFFDTRSKRPFTRKEKDLLVTNGFFLEDVPENGDVQEDDMTDDYVGLRVGAFGKDYSTVPLFVSSDLLLHVYHVVFDRGLQQAEERKLYYQVRRLTHDMYQKSMEAYAPGSQDEVHKATLINMAFFGIAGSLLDSTFVVMPEVKGIVDEELQLISNAAGLSLSPFAHKQEDYSQYKPRGHYTKSRRLSQYFRAMMWYGRQSFPVDSVDWTIAAIQQVQICCDPRGAATGELRKQLAGTFRYLVGAPDNLDCDDFEGALKKVYGEQFYGQRDFGDDPKLSQFMKQIRLLARPRIADRPLPNRLDPGSIEMGYRLFGQAFTPDAWIFTRLTSPRVGTDDQPRNMPTALDVMTVLGSPPAGDMVKEYYQVPNYESSLTQLKAAFAAYPDNTWTQSVYWTWLNTLRSLLLQKGNTYPFFVRTPYWTKKALLTCLGSWTELKHDTILMSKQSGSEMGEGDEETPPPTPPQPKSYIEPDLVFFNRFIGLVQTTAKTFSDNKILSDEYLRKFSLFLNRVVALREIVRKELLNAAISKQEYDLILDFAGDVAGIVIPEGSGDIIEPEYKQMALVCDVHTDFMSGRVLEEGVGSPQRIYVAVRDNPGGTRVCVGYVYTYYEFTQPFDKRMTDEEWKHMIYPEVKREVRSWEPEWISSMRLR